MEAARPSGSLRETAVVLCRLCSAVCGDDRKDGLLRFCAFAASVEISNMATRLVTDLVTEKF